MKLAPKLALCMVALLGVVFAVGGHVMVGESFNRSLEGAVQRHTATHLAGAQALARQLAQARYAEQQLWDYDYDQMGRELASGVAGAGGSLAVLGESRTAYFSNLPRGFGKSVQTAIMGAQQPGYLFYRFEGRTYLAMPAEVWAGSQRLWLISAFDLTPLFTERQQQTATFYSVYAAVLAAATLLGAGLALVVVRPLRRLSDASREIAQGAYHQRTGISRKDEIGQVARHFDEMAAAVEETVERLELSVRQRQDFMAAFTHELKTPMTAMLGYAALLERDALPGPEREKALTYIHSQTARLEALSQKLLALLGLGDEAVELAPASLADVMETVRAAFPDYGPEALVLPDGTDLFVEADADLLADLVINLVQNAWQAHPADGVVRVALETDGEAVVLSVADRGRGIPPDELSRVEEPFYRVDKSRAGGGGTGLGLALAARIATLHGAKLDYQSVEGQGTAVSLRLARAAREEGL